MLFISWGMKMKMSVRENEIYGASLSLLVSLGYDSLFISSIFSMKMKFVESWVSSYFLLEKRSAISMLYVSREWRSWRWKGIKALFVITSTTCMMIYSYQRHDQNETFLFKKSNHENPWNVTKIQRVTNESLNKKTSLFTLISFYLQGFYSVVI